jgi:type VI secretion system protein ImpA
VGESHVGNDTSTRNRGKDHGPIRGNLQPLGMKIPTMRETSLSESQFNAILEPIEGDSRTGICLDVNSYGSPHYAARAARDEAEKCEAEFRKWQLETIDYEPKEKPKWKPVIEKTTELLTKTSKDLRAAAWLSEALIRVDGIPGLRQGLSLCVELTDRFWDDLHPQPDEEEGHNVAVSGLRKLFGDLTVRALDDLSFVETNSAAPPGSANRITFQQFRNASEFDQITDEAKRAKRHDRLGWLTTAEFLRVAELTPTPFLRETHDDLNAAIELVYRLAEFLREHCLPDRYGESTAPESEIRQFRTQIEWMAETVGKLLGQRGDTEAADQSRSDFASANSSDGQTNASPQLTIRQQAIGNREDAFRIIEEIASYFEKQEPHSPVYSGLRQIARWGRMSLPELLRELLEDDSTLESVRKRVGLPPDPQD